MGRRERHRRRIADHFLPAHVGIAAHPGECGAGARRDLEAYFKRIAPEDLSAYTHNDEGPDDMPAHLRAALTQTQLTIPVQAGRPALGTWQGVFLFEHRREPPRRHIVLHLIGD